MDRPRMTRQEFQQRLDQLTVDERRRSIAGLLRHVGAEQAAAAYEAGEYPSIEAIETEIANHSRDSHDDAVVAEMLVDIEINL
jgi:hypothetical protein